MGKYGWHTVCQTEEKYTIPHDLVEDPSMFKNVYSKITLLL